MLWNNKLWLNVAILVLAAMACTIGRNSKGANVQATANAVVTATQPAHITLETPIAVPPSRVTNVEPIATPLPPEVTRVSALALHTLTGPAKGPPALGQAVYDASNATAIALREAAGLSTTAAGLRSPGQIPQCFPGYIHLWRALIDQSQ